VCSSDLFSELPPDINIASAMVAPLVVENAPIGVLCIKRMAERTNVQFTEHDLESFKLFAVHAALVLSALRHMQALLELDRMKSEFVANVSHELRTPLMALGGALDLLPSYIDGAPHAEKITKFVELMARNTARMRFLVNDLLDFSQIQSGKLTLRPKPFALRDLVRETLEDFTGRALSKNVTLAARYPETEPALTADRERIGQVLANLIGNAVKFTPGGGSVTVAYRDDGPEHLVISVADTGIGIPPAHRDKIFREFYQVDGSLSRDHGGFGLGLAIVKSIVEKHGGAIGVESETGKGSTFSVRLPCAAAQEAL
jgi:signal transduction histidine kinase